MSDMFTINSNCPSIIYINKLDRYGGLDYKIEASSKFMEMFYFFSENENELKKLINKEKNEAGIRQNNEFVNGLYEQYQTALRLVSKEKI